MDNNIGSRIIKIAIKYNVNKPSEFSKKTGFNHQTSSNYLKGRVPTAENLAIIQQSFDKINPEWLLTGKGEMLKSDTHTTVIGKGNIVGDKNNNNTLYNDNIIQQSNEEVFRLKIEFLEKENKSLKEQIEFLKTLINK